MLSLLSSTPVSWVANVEQHLEEVLIDHGHCEKKAAGTAMSMIFAYVEHPPFVRPLAEIVKEQLEHFEEVLDILEARDVTFRGQPQSSYGRRLGELICRHEPAKAVDRCLVAALIEARSCERFLLLRDHLQDRQLAAFYGRLLESEARHHATYVRLAGHFAPQEAVRQRLQELARAEKAIVAEGDPLPRLHS